MGEAKFSQMSMNIIDVAVDEVEIDNEEMDNQEEME